MMGVVIIPSSVIITNLVDGFSLDEWLFAQRSEKVYLKVFIRCVIEATHYYKKPFPPPPLILLYVHHAST